MTNDELRGLVAKKGLEAAGKKHDLVEAMLLAEAQEADRGARRERLRALGSEELQRLLLRNGLQPGSLKPDAMVAAFMAHETKVLDGLRAYEARVDEFLVKKKEELETESNARLKDLCDSKGLKPGLAKGERVERLVDAVRREGEVD